MCCREGTCVDTRRLTIDQLRELRIKLLLCMISGMIEPRQDLARSDLRIEAPQGRARLEELDRLSVDRRKLLKNAPPCEKARWAGGHGYWRSTERFRADVSELCVPELRSVRRRDGAWLVKERREVSEKVGSISSAWVTHRRDNTSPITDGVVQTTAQHYAQRRRRNPAPTEPTTGNFKIHTQLFHRPTW